MARREYDDETKAAVMAALLTGQSINAVAREYKIPKATVSSWRERNLQSVAANATQKGTPIDDLLSGYLKENLRTLRAQAEFFREETWLKQQEASQLAVLHGVLSDKAIRLLEAFGDEPEPGA
jgi:transposase-like protein